MALPLAGMIGYSVRSATEARSIQTSGAGVPPPSRSAMRSASFLVSGWWKEKPGLQRWDRSARYALLISVRAPGANIDIYTPIAIQLAIPIPAAERRCVH